MPQTTKVGIGAFFRSEIWLVIAGSGFSSFATRYQSALVAKGVASTMMFPIGFGRKPQKVRAIPPINDNVGTTMPKRADSRRNTRPHAKVTIMNQAIGTMLAL